jgi:hypothetical protein
LKSQWHGRTADILRKEEQEEQAELHTLSWQARALHWAKHHRYGIIGMSWVSAMAVSGGLIFARNPGVPCEFLSIFYIICGTYLLSSHPKDCASAYVRPRNYDCSASSQRWPYRYSFERGGRTRSSRKIPPPWRGLEANGRLNVLESETGVYGLRVGFRSLSKPFLVKDKPSKNHTFPPVAITIRRALPMQCR